MPNFDTRTLRSSKRRTAPSLHLVESAAGSSFQDASDAQHIAEAETADSLAWKLFSAFGPVGDALHAFASSLSSCEKGCEEQRAKE